MTNERPGYSSHLNDLPHDEVFLSDIENSWEFQSSRFESLQDYSHYNSDEAFLRELAADLNDDDNQLDEFEMAGNDEVPRMVSRGFAQGPAIPGNQCSSRPRLSSAFLLKGLVERSQHYNKTIDRRVMTGARIAFEEEQLRNGRRQQQQDMATHEMNVLAASCQNVPKRGRGDCFGRLRSADLDEDVFSSSEPSFSRVNYERFQHNNPYLKKSIPPPPQPPHNYNMSVAYPRNPHLGSQTPSSHHSQPNRTNNDATPPARHHFNPDTAYNGKITPNFRFNYNPQATITLGVLPVVVPPTKTTSFSGFVQPAYTSNFTPSGRFGQRYPKRPDNNPQQPTEPKHLNHNYYQIELHGATQEERIAQRIEKTVRQTETPLRRF